MKLNLPTVETCPWRSLAVADNAAGCGLVSSLLDIQPNLCMVTTETCQACCESFPPSSHRLNPIVASVLYRLVSQIGAGTLEADVDPDRLAPARLLAESGLATDYPQAFQVRPAREHVDCVWFGEPTSDSLTDRGLAFAELPAVATPNDSQAVHDCLHPDHELTTGELCRRCRDWSSSLPISPTPTLAAIVPPPAQRFGFPVRNWAVAVTTAPRRESTLAACLDSIRRAGWESPHLFLDGSCRIPQPHGRLAITWREHSIGAWPAWFAALRELVSQQPNADAYVMLQDDVVLFDREPLTAYLSECLWPSETSGLVSLFYTRPDTRVGWHRANFDWHFSAQGLILSPAIAHSMLCDPRLMYQAIRASSSGHLPIPTAIVDWCRRTRTEVWYTNPSLAEHIGNTSVIWDAAMLNDGRRAAWFSGSVDTPLDSSDTFADFPEQAFPCSEPVRDDYQDRVERGRCRMRDRRVVLLGLCRDVRIYLARTTARLERLGAMFADYRVVIFENDSSDQTDLFLRQWRDRNPLVDVISERMGVDRFPQARNLQRAAWLAECRNRTRDWALERYGEFDVAIVFDADLLGGWSSAGIAHTFGHDDWDSVGSYGLRQRLAPAVDDSRYEHVDVWAFRPAPATKASRLIDHTRLQLTRGEPLLPVESCFGGLGVYRMDCFRAAEYGGGDCEHVVFHRRLRAAGYDRQFLNPSQLVLYSPLAGGIR